MYRIEENESDVLCIYFSAFVYFTEDIKMAFTWSSLTLNLVTHIQIT